VLAQSHPTLQPWPSKVKQVLRRFDRVFFITVFLPTLLAAAYYGLIASDVYISESRFVVRSPQRQQATGLSALLQGGGFSRSQDDTYAVHDFILSRDALKLLQDQLRIRDLFTRSGIDFVNRFPGPERWDDSFEALYRHYLRHVSVESDSSSAITVLFVRAYTAEDANKMNEALLEMGEQLVNNMNTRSRRDVIQSAQQEVKAAEERAKAAAVALSSYRSDRSVFDPERQSAIQLQSVARLREELLTAEAQLAQVRMVSPTNPQISSLAARVQGLRAAIADENARVLGREGGLSAKSPAYERLALDHRRPELALERTFADRQLGAAMISLDNANNEAARKQLYLERLVQPNRPDKALEPRRLRSVAAVLLVGLMVWGVVSLVLVSVREHTS
jgi:capsular polysaccharide transport system permease protein